MIGRMKMKNKNIFAMIIICFLLSAGIVYAGEFQEGFTYTSWWHSDYLSSTSDASLDKLRDSGVEYVSLLVTWYQDDVSSTDIYRWSSKTPSDSALIEAIDDIHSRGMKVMLKPHVDPKTGWRGDIEPADWNAWFSNYTAFISYYASLAESNNVEQFCVGTELKKSTPETAQWQDVIADVRGLYSGNITYAANWDNYENVNFWNSLDYIGIDAYFPLTAKNDPTLQELEDSWVGYKTSLSDFSDANSKNVIFTEIGYQSIDRTNMHPWWSTGTYDEQEQADCYRAALEILLDESWLEGIYWWDWYYDHDDDHDNYGIFGKPAHEVVKEFYCDENWQIQYGDCLVTDLKLKYYIDINNCGTTKDIPDDNGTYASCDYCIPDWQPYNTSCTDGNLTKYYEDDNNCYAQTGLSSDIDGRPANQTFGCGTIACSADSDCGTDGFLGNNRCNADDIWDDYRTYTCLNPGTISAECSSDDNYEIKETCTGTCNNRTCVDVTCSADSDCGADGYLGDDHCQGTDVWETYREYTCLNPGTLEAECSYSGTEQEKEVCSEVCEDGQCMEFGECVVPTSGMEITENTIFCKGEYNLTEGINIIADNVVLDCNESRLFGDSYEAIYLSGKQGITVKNCDIDIFKGITVENGKDIIVKDNTLYGKIYLQGDDSTIQGNDLSYIYAKGSNILIKENSLRGVDETLRLYRIYGSSIIDNHIESISYWGRVISMDGVWGTLFQGNTIEYGKGFYCWYRCENNIIKDNNFSRNYYSIGGDADDNFKNNTFYQNSFIDAYHHTGRISNDNTFQHDQTGNRWSSFDEPGEGCEDSDSDGICDSSYEFGEGLWDYYPVAVDPGSINPPVCSFDSDCGADEFIGNASCNGDDVWDSYVEYTCLNPGTLEAECVSVEEYRLKNICDDTCYDGSCVEVACSIDSECGDDKYIGNTVCSGDHVVRDYRTYSCSSPGTPDSLCSYSDEEKLIVECQYGCEQGICKTGWACSIDSDCGTDRFADEDFCKNGNVWDIYEEHICLNPETADSECSTTEEERLKKECENGCSDGKCIDEPVCSADSDCGIDGYVGNTNCSGNKVIRDYRTYTCSSSGTADAECSYSYEARIIEECENGCRSGSCIPEDVITCHSDSGCGDDDWKDVRYCDNGDSYQIYEKHKCIYPGTAESECMKVEYEKKKESCEHGCSNGYCMEEPGDYRCSKDSDCGDDGFIGDPECNGGDIYQIYRAWSCFNPSTKDAYCRYNDRLELVEECAGACSEGECMAPECTTAADCGTDRYVGEAFCSEGDAYQSFRTWGCNAGVCSYSDISQFKQECSSRCLNGVCIVEHDEDEELPDLKTRYLFNQYPKSPGAGDRITIIFDLENIGNKDAEDIAWRLYSGSSDPGDSGTVSRLKKGKGMFIVAILRYAAEGTYYPRLEIDYQNKIEELDETNNQNDMQLEVV
ncbi:hypothetical protein GF336_01585 [Candidatus Woesearchaeota archaeon]|nr:hypothetical protein [Candidatus Woesearchaeota archaeon]